VVKCNHVRRGCRNLAYTVICIQQQLVCVCVQGELEKLIYPVGFFRNKAKYVRAAAQRIAAGEWGGDIPGSIEALCSLKGVGPKMAFICMNSAWGRHEGIGVDVHVHRIAARLRWTHAAKNPEDTRASLEAWLPRKLWHEVNHIFVGFGQTVCLPRTPLCGECSVRPFCPEGRRWKAPASPASGSGSPHRRTAQRPEVQLEGGTGKRTRPDSPESEGAKLPRTDE